MIEQNDLRAAVAAGIVSEAQAASLSQLAHARTGARSDLDPHDEPFELFKGFNEIFIVVGLIILAVGWSALNSVFVVFGGSGTIQRAVLSSAVGAGILWFLAEYFIRNRRMVAPTITLTIFWGINAAVGLTAALSHPFMVAQEDFSSLPLPLGLSTLAVLLFWARFRVPIALALVALGAFAVAIVLAAESSGSPNNFEDLFLLSAGGPFALITLGIGTAVFVAAMAFDMSDPHRVTRRAAQGFWLHVVAAPALVNTIALTLLQQDSGLSNLLLAAFLAVIAVIAIIIDRRSFLIAAVGYCVALSATLFDGSGAAYVILILGVVLLLLGAYWDRIRARILTLFSGVLPLSKLPPSQRLS